MDSKKKDFMSQSGKIIIVLFVFALIIASASDLFGLKNQPVSSQTQSEGSFLLKARNLRIRSIKPSVRCSKSCVYSEEDIIAAAEVVKENFMNRDIYVSLSSVEYDEKVCDKIRNSFQYSEEYGEKNCLVLLCSYNVYKSHAAYSAGYFEDYNVILVRENQSSSWEIKDQGYG
ncbi:MAG: hypothetical protein IJ262_08095 [Clostridia bacterium]|nr:hypothetical protein [Clostridia bacterium]